MLSIFSEQDNPRAKAKYHKHKRSCRGKKMRGHKVKIPWEHIIQQLRDCACVMEVVQIVGIRSGLNGHLKAKLLKKN